jgi:DMSO/TMAO reductase YedYZ molybdopterin-dependent catalytic subunit
MKEPQHDAVKESAKLTRRSFLVGGVAAAVGAAGLTWLDRVATEDGIPWPLRRVLEFNEAVGRAAFSEHRLAPTFSEAIAASGAEMRVNGTIGLTNDVAQAWSLQVETDAGPVGDFSLEDLQAVPKTRMVTDFKCIEGWSQFFSWAGVALRDFMFSFGIGNRHGGVPNFAHGRGDIYQYVAMATPDRSYYVGLDRDSAIHPQTLLCYEMGGAPLTAEHGAPLRLAIPVKYGVKNIKRIGLIRFTDTRPADYWAERGYDWFAGH